MKKGGCCVTAALTWIDPALPGTLESFSTIQVAVKLTAEVQNLCLRVSESGR